MGAQNTHAPFFFFLVFKAIILISILVVKYSFYWLIIKDNKDENSCFSLHCVSLFFFLYILSLLAGKFDEICTAFPLTIIFAKT